MYLPRADVCGDGFGEMLLIEMEDHMKKEIHPKYVDAKITCACGEVIQTRSTKKEIRVGVCSKCHPFFTGTQKYLDTAGRVEKFMKKYAGVKSKKKIRTRAGETEVPAVGTVSAPAAAGVAAGAAAPESAPPSAAAGVAAGAAAPESAPPSAAAGVAAGAAAPESAPPSAAPTPEGAVEQGAPPNPDTEAGK